MSHLALSSGTDQCIHVILDYLEGGTIPSAFLAGAIPVFLEDGFDFLYEESPVREPRPIQNSHTVLTILVKMKAGVILPRSCEKAQFLL